MPQLTPKRYRTLIAALIAIHLAVALPLAYALNVWADEGSTLYSTQHGFANAFFNAAIDEKQAPLYFWFLSLWRMVDPSIFFARLFSIISTAIAIAVFSRIAKQLFDTRLAFIATACFALHPFLLWASLEIRVYALVILITAVLIDQFLLAFCQPDNPGGRQRALISISIISCIALYTNYYLGFLFPAFLGVLIVQRRWRDARDLALTLLPATVVFIPQIFVIKAQFAANSAGYQEPAGVADSIITLYHHVLTYALPAGNFLDESPTIVRPIRLIVVIAAAVLTVGHAVWKRPAISKITIGLLALNASIFALYLAAGLAVGTDYIVIRHASVCFVPLLLFIISILRDVFVPRENSAGAALKLLGWAAGVITLGAFVYSATMLYPGMAKRGDWTRVAAYLESNEKAGQPIVVFVAFDALALRASYHGTNRVLPERGYFSFFDEAVSGSENSLARQAAFVISAIPVDADQIWVVTNEKCSVTDACVPLEKYLMSNYTVIQEVNFYKEKVRFLRKIKNDH